MYTVLVVKLVDSVDLVTMGFVLTTISVVLVTCFGSVIMLVSTVVFVRVIGTVVIDDLDVTTVDVTGQVVLLHNINVSASVGFLINYESLRKSSRYVSRCKACGPCGFSLGHRDPRDARYDGSLRFSNEDSLRCGTSRNDGRRDCPIRVSRKLSLSA